GISGCIQRSRPEIKKIASLFALVKRPQLGTEQFIKFVGGNVCTAFEPAVADLEAARHQTEHCKMLSGIYFQLQAHGNAGLNLSIETIVKSNSPSSLLPLRSSKP